MAPSSDLVMPKLGLTMTEGRIARWAVGPGEHFSKGSVVVEIETDKIVNEVEAPAAGTLLAQVVSAGENASVGAVIARWQLDAGTAPAIAAAEPVEARRIIATPYARRLAKDAGLALAGVRGTGPAERIKAADVVRAIETKTRPAERPSPDLSVEPPPSLGTLVAQPASSAGAAPSESHEPSFAVTDIDAGRLLEIERRLARQGAARPFERHHVAAFACLRALERTRVGGATFTLGLSADAAADGSAARIVARSDTSWATFADELAGAVLNADGGDMLICSGSEDVRLFGPAVPPGWAAVMALGAVRLVPRPSPTNEVLWGHEISVVLSYSTLSFSNAAALRLLHDLKDALEDPLHLFAT